jgi:hypothetical protein
MKTTSGKTTATRRHGRVVHIFGEKDDLLAIIRAPTLRQALLDYAKVTLSGYGWTKPAVVGNVLTIKTKTGRVRSFTAREVK